MLLLIDDLLFSFRYLLRNQAYSLCALFSFASISLIVKMKPKINDSKSYFNV